MGLSKTEAEQAYRSIFDRVPTQEEIENAIAHYPDLQTLRAAFLNSDEFERKYARMKEQQAAQQPPTLIHLHIPKTAGTTLAEALAAQPDLQPNMVVHDVTLDDLRALPRGRRRALRYIRGHLSLGAEEALGTPHRFLCLIRRPGPRIFSFYQFIKRTRTHPTHALLNERNMSFGDYLEFSVDQVPHRLEIDNGQIRRLAGRFDPQGFGQEQALLRAAIRTALSPDMVFGFVEHFDMFARTLFAEGLLSDPDLKAVNVSPNSDQYQSAVDSLTERQAGIFDSYTAWDTYFYDVCEALMMPMD